MEKKSRVEYQHEYYLRNKKQIQDRKKSYNRNYKEEEKKQKDKTKTFGFRLSLEQAEKFERKLKDDKISKSEFFQDCINKYINE